MISWDAAWARQKECKTSLVQGKVKSEFRSIYYTQKVENIAIGATSANLNRDFPAGAIILGIDASAILPRIVKKDQYYADADVSSPDTTFDRQSTSPANLDLFSLAFQYTNDEVITPGGPCLASALLGPNGGMFPARELVVDPSQAILATVKNEIVLLQYDGTAAPATPAYSITVHIRYAAMVPRGVG